MITSLSAVPVAALALGLIIALIVLLVLQIVTGMRVQRLTQPIYEYARAQSQAEGDRIVNEAHETARKIVADSQLAVTALIEKQHTDIEAQAQAYRRDLESLSITAKSAITDGTDAAKALQADVMHRIAADIEAQGADLRKSIGQIEENLDGFSKQSRVQVGEIEKVLGETGKSVTDGFKAVFSDVSTVGKKRIDERIDQLLTDAETEVRTYRDARKRLVDEHMADLITETSKIVLRKTLTADEHAELVDRALKEARTAGMI